MTRYATFLNPALVDNEGLNKYLSRLFTAGVATSFNSTGWKVVQRGAGANMSVDVSVGDGFLILPTGTYGYWGWTDAAENVAVTAANATNPRIDVVIAKIVTSTTSTSQANSPGALVFQVMAGTPSGSPAAMSDSAIQAAIGSAVPWIKLATVSVAAASTSVVNANITDARTSVNLLAPLASNAVSTVKIVDAAVTSRKAALTIVGADGDTVNPVPTSSTDITNSSVTFSVDTASYIYITMSGTHQRNSSDAQAQTLIVDGAAQARNINARGNGSGTPWWTASRSYKIPLTAGSHTIKMQCGAQSSGNGVITEPSWWGIVVSQ